MTRRLYRENEFCHKAEALIATVAGNEFACDQTFFYRGADTFIFDDMMSGDMAKYTRMILRGAISALFFFAGVMKLRNPHGFAQFGYSDAFGIFIGMAEVCGAVGLWIPRVARMASIGLAIIMVGAVLTNLRIGGEPRQGVVPVVVLFGLTRLVMKQR